MNPPVTLNIVPNAAWSVNRTLILLVFLLFAPSWTRARASGPPVIALQPKSQSIAAGYRTILRVTTTTVSGTSIQWRHNGADLAGATSSVLLIDPTMPHHAGQYSVRVTNPEGSVMSDEAVLTVVGEFPYTFSTFAGTGAPGTVNAHRLEARFSQPLGVLLDGKGNAYLTERGVNVIRKIGPDGLVTNFAGRARTQGAVDGVGEEARFNYAGNMAMDSKGNIYLADTSNNTIRKITTPDAVVTTLAGKPQFNNQGGAIGGSTDGLGEAARFNGPWRLAIDAADNIYVADSYNFTVRRITPEGEVTTYAGRAGSEGIADGDRATARFSVPNGLAFDAAGNLYVCDQNNFTIRKVAPDGTVSTLAGRARVSGFADGKGGDARFGTLFGMSIDAAGNLYVTDSNHVIRKVLPDGTVVTLAGFPGTTGATEGLGRRALFNEPGAAIVDAAGNLYVNDHTNHRIRKGSPTPFIRAADLGFKKGEAHPEERFGFTISAPSGPFVMESSANLKDWVPFTSGTSTGPLELSDSESPSIPQRFYRLRVP